MPQIGTQSQPFLLTRLSRPRVIRVIRKAAQAVVQIVETAASAKRRTVARELVRWPNELHVDETSEHNFYAGLDPGPTGIFVATRRAARIDEQVVIRFTLPARVSPIVVRCRTQWIREHNALTGALLAGIGFQFCDIDEDALRSVREFSYTREPVFWE